MANNKSPYDLYCRISIVLALAMACAAYSAVPPRPNAWAGMLAFLLLAICAELMPVSIRSNQTEIVISSPIHWVAMLLYGPFVATAVAVTAYGAVNVTAWLSGRYFLKHGSDGKTGIFRDILAFLAGYWGGRADYPARWALKLISANCASHAILACSAAAVYLLAGGIIGAHNLLASASTWMVMLQVIFPFMLSVGAYFLVDESLYVIVIIVFENRPEDFRDWYSFALRWKMLFVDTVPLSRRQYLFLPPITLLLVYLYIHLGVWSGLVILGPFFAFRLSVQKSVEQQQVYLDTIAALGTYMQHYHPYTRGHLKRVADMSERLARELHLASETVILMPYAGLLHDIGKVGVSEEILDKVGKLTDEEWASIREHPVKGAEIVAHLDFLNSTVDWIKYHHKWADGSGYPDDGAKNGGVPIEAAIIAVADAFDAMTDDREMSLDWTCDSCGYKPEDGVRPGVCPKCNAPKHRVYRQPLTTGDAINELRRGAGSQFNPEVVKAFLTMVDREGIRVGGS